MLSLEYQTGLPSGQPGYRAPPGAVPAGYMGYAGAGGMKMNKKGKMKKVKVKGMKVGKKPKMSKLFWGSDCLDNT